jgi:hypothetical protein
MAKPVLQDVNVLAGVIQSLGGTLVPAPTLQFDLPLAQVRDVIPRLNELGVGCRKLSERVEENPTKMFSDQSVVRIECHRPDETPPRLTQFCVD